MLSFTEFLLEGKHEIIDNHRLHSDSPEHYIKAALTHPHAGVVAYGVRHYNPTKHPNLADHFDAATKHKDWWVRAEAAKHQHLTPEQKQNLSTDKNSKVSSSFGSTVSAKQDAPKPAKLTKQDAPKQAKPASKDIPSISVQSGDPEEHGLPKETKITHALQKNKSFATAISSVRPAFGELDRDETIHQAFVGDHKSKDGLKHIGNYPTHKQALLAAVKHSQK